MAMCKPGRAVGWRPGEKGGGPPGDKVFELRKFSLFLFWPDTAAVFQCLHIVLLFNKPVN